MNDIYYNHDPEMSIHHISSSKSRMKYNHSEQLPDLTKKIYVNLRLGNKRQHFELDNGSTVIFLSQRDFD